MALLGGFVGSDGSVSSLNRRFCSYDSRVSNISGNSAALDHSNGNLSRLHSSLSLGDFLRGLLSGLDKMLKVNLDRLFVIDFLMVLGVVHGDLGSLDRLFGVVLSFGCSSL